MRLLSGGRSIYAGPMLRRLLFLLPFVRFLHSHLQGKWLLCDLVAPDFLVHDVTPKSEKQVRTAVLDSVCTAQVIA